MRTREIFPMDVNAWWLKQIVSDVPHYLGTVGEFSLNGPRNVPVQK